MTAPYDLAPLGAILLVGVVLALAPLAWLWSRDRRATPRARRRALTWVTLFLTFDLVLFGAFTRLSDSGLGCPDWPGCYGSASPVGASSQIGVAQAATPTGPVTHTKAWIEMTHRYLATAVGALITLLAALTWIAAWRGRTESRSSGRIGSRARRWQDGRTDADLGSAPISPWWPTLTLAWVCLQGAFGALTVTMKLYPAIVTLHLLGGIGLLVLLAAQSQAFEPSQLAVPRPLRLAFWAVAALALVQIALGGWVSTNYAVLACRDFPTCQGHWWPTMNFAEGFSVVRGLGRAAGGDGYLPFAALTAIHEAHRIGAIVVLGAIGLLAWRLSCSELAPLRRFARLLAGIGAWQLASGLGNVVFGWPLAAAVAHTAGAAALAMLLTVLLMRTRPVRQRAPAYRPADVSAQSSS